MDPATHVIFDLDGLLLNTEELYSQGTNNVISKYGKNYSWKVKETVMGKGPMEVAKIMCDTYQLPLTPEDYRSEVKAQYSLILPGAKLMPGAFELVKHLKNFNIPIAIATSSTQQEYDYKIHNHKDFIALFDLVLLGPSDPEVKRNKPFPDIFSVCACRFPEKPIPEKCLVFEDSPNGVEAALAAGMRVVMVPDPRTTLNIDKATLVIKSLSDFKPENFGLPPYPL